MVASGDIFFQNKEKNVLNHGMLLISVIEIRAVSELFLGVEF